MSDAGGSGGDPLVYYRDEQPGVLGNFGTPPSVASDASQPSILGSALNPQPWTPADNSLNFFVDPDTMKTIDFDGNPAPQAALALNGSDAAAAGDPALPASASKQGTVIFIGGAGDSSTGIVSDYAKPFGDQHANLDVQYFPHDQGKEVQDYVKSLPPGTDVSLVGHSWGADTAAKVTQSLGEQNIPVKTLVTIDPVGHGWDDGFMSNVANNTDRWVNVQADPSFPNFSDGVAFLGGRVGTDVKPYVDEFIVSPNHHGDFGPMMDQAPTGTQSPKDAIVGATPAPRAAPGDGDD